MNEQEPHLSDGNFWTVTKKKRERSLTKNAALFFVVCALSISLFAYHQTRPPAMKNGAVIFEVRKGMSVQSIAHEAQKNGLVHSELLLQLILRHRYDPTKIYAGIYRFDKPLSVFAVAQKLAQSDIDKTVLKVTIPEGSTRKDIAQIVQQKLPDFDAESFLKITEGSEGYLFPDTYLVRSDFSAQEFADLLRSTYALKIDTLHTEIASSSLNEQQILTLASIIEREANDEISMRTVSGILQKRLALNMPLQTDATIEYDMNKSLSELTADDLKADTPYNTYIHTGLPPTPIDNPGLQSIKAVLEPIKTDYLYYLTDAEGNFHYSTTFEAHKDNIKNYLK